MSENKNFCEVDISEDNILKLSPDLLDTLLKDQTLSLKNGSQSNIFWATSDYEYLGKGFEYKSPILPELITGEYGHVIMPRILKSRDTQRDRSREMAEVFTPSWVCNAQNNLIDNEWLGYNGAFNHENNNHTWVLNPNKIEFPKGKTWQDYVMDIRLEITCGEAPYIVSRYDTATGEAIPINNRIGLLDRKLRVVGENTETKEDWLEWAEKAYKSVYGYEWQGDNLLIARENLLVTFIDYHREKFDCDPPIESIMEIANIISWNIWQMDGLKCVIPNSCHSELEPQIDLFSEQEFRPCQGCFHNNINKHNGTYCKIRDWEAKPPKDIIKFVDLIKNERHGY